MMMSVSPAKELETFCNVKLVAGYFYLGHKGLLLVFLLRWLDLIAA